MEIVIPEGASLPEPEKGFMPRGARLFIGVNNTVVWINRDLVSHAIVADSNFEPDLGANTNRTNRLYLGPGESSEYTFTRPGMYSFHGEPGPHIAGMVIVYPELLKEPFIELSVQGLKSSYKAGEPVTFDVTARGYGSDCNSIFILIEDLDAPDDFSYSVGASPGCVLETPFRDFEHRHQVVSGITEGSWDRFPTATINQTGRYMLQVAYGDEVLGWREIHAEEFEVVKEES